MQENNISWIAPAIMDSFSGHIPKDTVIIRKSDPSGNRRAIVLYHLYPKTQEGRCGAVDLLHPSERNTPRCNNPDCRCMQPMED